LKKINSVENGNKKENAKEKESWSGTRTKKFVISGEINVSETQSGGLCEAKSVCESDTGSKEVQSLTRLGDNSADVEPICSKSAEPRSICGCGCH
jgi:hypothetical protein